MWRYAGLLPVLNQLKIVTLGEGGTPLVPSFLFPNHRVFSKNETANPTGSHKDRSLSIAITKAVEFGFDTSILYSDGSAALSSAAYAARAGLRNIVVAPGGTPDSRLLPLMVYNSTVLEYQGPGAEAVDWVHEASQTLGIYETTTYRRANPYSSEGPKTISYEIVEELGNAPDWMVVPVGGGGTLAGIWRGFLDLKTREITDKLPRMIGVLPAGYRLLELGLQKGAESDDDLRALADFHPPQSAQAKLAMSFPPDGVQAIAAVRDSGGRFVYASDAEALAAQRRMGASEGIYAEVSAAVSVVAIDKLIQSQSIREHESVVSLICGSGFRETGELALSLHVRKTRIARDRGFEEVKRIVGI